MSSMLLLFAAVLALVLINVPIAVSLGIVSVVAMVATHGVAILRSSPTMARRAFRCSPFRCSSSPAPS
jgi:hypothetical protein